MAWEFVLVNESGINVWKLRSKQEAESQECPAPRNFSIDGANTIRPPEKVLELQYSSNLFLSDNLSEERPPDEVVGLSHNNELSVSGANSVGKSAIHLNNSNSIIFTDYTNNNTSLTISLWVYPTSVSGNNCYLLGSKIPGGSNCWSLLRDGSNWRCIWDQNDIEFGSLGTVDLNQWQHISISWHLDGSNSGLVKFYKNGVLEDDSRDGVSDGPSGEWTIGARSDNGSTIVGNRFEGYLSSISFHESVLSDAEVLELAKAGHDQDLSSDFGNYTSAGTLALAILGGTGSHRLEEDYPDSYTEVDSVYVQSLVNYDLDVTANTTGGTPHVEPMSISYVNKFPEPIP